MRLPDEFKRNRLAMSWGNAAWWEREGPGPTVLFLHGSGCDSTDWVPLIGHLPRHYRVVLTDFRGHGRSDAPPEAFTFDDLVADVGALLDHLGIQGAVVAGHSLGGMVALGLARSRRELVASLALYEGWVSLSAVPEGWDTGPGNLPGAERERITPRARKTVARDGAANWLRFWRSLEEFDARPFLDEHSVRVIAVWGDRAGPRPGYEELHVPRSMAIQHLWVQGAGHYMLIERPRVSAQAVVRLARRAEQDGRRSIAVQQPGEETG